jgi:hypothetical protein
MGDASEEGRTSAPSPTVVNWVNRGSNVGKASQSPPSLLKYSGATAEEAVPGRSAPPASTSAVDGRAITTPSSINSKDAPWAT